MRINDFVAHLNTGMARTNRFSVVMDVPVMLNGVTPWRNLLLFCDQVQLPGLSINTQPIRIFGEVRETPYEFNYEPIQLSFYVDGDMHVKAYFDRWVNSIQNGDRRTYKYYRDYICDQFQILVQDVSDNTVHQVTLFEAYPKSVSAIQMDYASKDIMKIQVSMVYKYWESAAVATDHKYNDPTKSKDINNTSFVPKDYLSDFNQFQQNLGNNIRSGINSGIEAGSNAIKSASAGIEAGVAEVKSWLT